MGDGRKTVIPTTRSGLVVRSLGISYQEVEAGTDACKARSDKRHQPEPHFRSQTFCRLCS